MQGQAGGCMIVKTKEHQRSATAERLVAQRKQMPERDRSAYSSLCQRLPALVRGMGLCQALHVAGFLDSDAAQWVLDDLSVHLTEAGLLSRLTTPAGGSVVAAALEADLIRYIRLTREVMAALLWHERLSRRMLGVRTPPPRNSERQ